MDTGGFIDTITLPTAGTYRIVIDPLGAVTGSITLTLYDVPADAGGPITAGGSSVVVTTATPGQNGSLTFTGTAGQRISLAGTAATGYNQTFSCDLNVTILKPDTTVMTGPACMDTGGFIDTITLPTAGTYTIAIDPVGGVTGSITMSLYDVSADVSGTITPGRSPFTVTITTPGQNGQLTFSGTANQKIALQGTNASGFHQTLWDCDLYVSILNPDTSTLVGATCMAAGGSIGATTLPTTGTYTIVVNPVGSPVGSITLTATNP